METAVRTAGQRKRPARVPLREQQKQFTRIRLLEAALEAFSARGYSAATIEGIASVAGAARATFYLHFDSKAEVVRELAQAAAADALFAGLSGMPDVSRDDLASWMAQAVQYWEEHRPVLPVIAQATGSNPGSRPTTSPSWSARSTPC